ncbi:MAG: hypothetical protein NVV66_12165 [Cellulomonas sp.]|uniref:hypothetical protein n=1 Tax=Cellulomonas sp. TaxID=40001 RepID=UPI0025832018|nr:hypothetical protein [Cellulomonas sp.]MCR6705401.1 hypothetical protein [Cellulomonas sp.]
MSRLHVLLVTLVAGLLVALGLVGLRRRDLAGWRAGRRARRRARWVGCGSSRTTGTVRRGGSMSDTGRPDEPRQPAPDRRPAWTPREDQPGWPGSSAAPQAPVGPPVEPRRDQQGQLPVRRTTPPPAAPTVTPRVGGTAPHGAHAGPPQGGYGQQGHAAPGGYGAPGGAHSGHGAHAAGPAAPTGPVPTGPVPGSPVPASPAAATSAFPAAFAATGAPVAGQPTTSEGQGSGPGTGGPEPESGDKRPKWLLPVAIGGGVLLVGAVAAGIVLANRGNDSASPEPLVATTIRLPSPTPSIEPVAREATTPFATALPSSVLQYALASSAPEATWVTAGALEAYTESFTDGGDLTATVLSGQWATQDEARAFTDALVAELPTAEAAVEGTSEELGATPSADATATTRAGAPASGRDKLPQTGAVRVGDERVGTYTAVALGDGTGVVVWRNLTAVFRIEAPVEDLLDLYRAFPL